MSILFFFFFVGRTQSNILDTIFKDGSFSLCFQIFYVPLALAVPPSVFWVHVQFNLLYQFWIHTEIVRSLGPLEYIFNNPSHHRVHHGNLKLCLIGQKLRA